MHGVAVFLLYILRNLLIEWMQEIQQFVMVVVGMNYSIVYPGNKNSFLKIILCP